MADMRELIQTWRRNAKHAGLAKTKTLTRCADELERALAAQPAPGRLDSGIVARFQMLNGKSRAAELSDAESTELESLRTALRESVDLQDLAHDLFCANPAPAEPDYHRATIADMLRAPHRYHTAAMFDQAELLDAADNASAMGVRTVSRPAPADLTDAEADRIAAEVEQAVGAGCESWDEVSPRDLIRAVHRAMRAAPAAAAVPDARPDLDPADLNAQGASASDHEIGYNQGWNDCRDAMLSAAPQPAAVKDSLTVARTEDWRVGMFERWNDHAKALGFAGLAEAISSIKPQPEGKAGADDADLEMRARDILADEYDRVGSNVAADCIRRGDMSTHLEARAIRAIMKALAQPKPAEGGAVKARIDEIEYAISCNRMNASQVFTQMRQLIRTAPAGSGEAVGEVNERGSIKWYSRAIPATGTRLYACPAADARGDAMTDTELIDFLEDRRQNIANVTLPEDIVHANIHSLRDALKEAARRWRESHD